MKRVNKVGLFLIVTVISLSFVFLGAAFSAEEEKEKKEKKPPRAFVLYPEYSGVVVMQGEEVRMDLIVENKGLSDEEVFIDLIDVPKGWKAKVKTYNFTVTGVHVLTDKSKTLTFLAEQEKGLKPGKYPFRLKGRSKDGKLQSECEIIVTVKAKEEAKKAAEDIVITTSYPVLRGPSDAKFEFSLEVENKMEKDMVFNLSARGPSEWEINLKPAYEDKYISSLRLKEKQSQSVAVVVKPPRYAKAGEYPVFVTVSSGEKKAEAKLMVVLTGTYKIDAATPQGILSLNAFRGKPANISLYVKNVGSATNHDLTFLSVKPENWNVKFEPEKIDVLEPGDLKQVEVTITPAEEALVGDYSVALNVKGEKGADKDVELRVTVKASTAWGWIGIGIIIFVIVGLVGLFIYLGRR